MVSTRGPESVCSSYGRAKLRWTHYTLSKRKGEMDVLRFPNGVQEEAAHYPDEESARAASWQAYRAWQAKGCRY